MRSFLHIFEAQIFETQTMHNNNIRCEMVKILKKIKVRVNTSYFCLLLSIIVSY